MPPAKTPVAHTAHEIPAETGSFLSIFPTWARFPAFMFGVCVVLVGVFSLFVRSAVGFLIPALLVCALVALSNLAARKFRINANRH